MIYAGEGVYCPLCERSCRQWVGGRAFGRCPFCMAASRSRFLWHLLEQRSELLSGDSPVLHFAPERCLRVRLEPKLGDRYVTTDLIRTDVTTQQDITQMSFEDEAFGTIICSHVLEHIPDDTRALSELARVLRPGGHLAVQVPLSLDAPTDEDPRVTDPAERKRRWGELDHVRMYGLDIAQRIAAAGFDVESVCATSVFDPAFCSHHGLRPNEMLFIGRRAGRRANVSRTR